MSDEAERETWELRREDENGHRSLVARGSAEELERRRLDFDGRGHKQTYWVTPARPSADPN